MVLTLLSHQPTSAPRWWRWKPVFLAICLRDVLLLWFDLFRRVDASFSPTDNQTGDVWEVLTGTKMVTQLLSNRSVDHNRLKKLTKSTSYMLNKAAFTLKRRPPLVCCGRGCLFFGTGCVSMYVCKIWTCEERRK